MLLVNNPGDWGNVYGRLLHAQVAWLDLHRLDLSVLRLHLRHGDDA